MKIEPSKKRFASVLLTALLLAFAFCGCTNSNSLLPSTQKASKTQWETFNQAKMAFDQIVPYKTTTEELKQLGFHPLKTPNIELLTYVEIIERFMPNPSIRIQDLDKGLQRCLESKESCRGYEMSLSRITDERFGNVVADLFGFRRRTKIQGWTFKAIIVLKSDLVVYKIAGGKPNVDELVDEKRPLGPLQNIGGESVLRLMEL